ncbi:unnamed protein product [Adineta ricciae]|uniref:Uncharacterized protein n=1 Tax=Adineta ricciae TaxID=249248 RepID=A0A814J187_ADIRI|nr:unnamed protein product [Adineta ricciae]
MTTSESKKYIQTVLLEILNRSAVWLGKGKRNDLNIGMFDAHKAALSFLEQYNRESVLKGQRINMQYMGEALHMIVIGLKYEDVNKNSKQVDNTTVEFVYRQILFGEIKWKNVITDSPKQCQSSISQSSRKDESEIAEDAKKLIESTNSPLETTTMDNITGTL